MAMAKCYPGVAASSAFVPPLLHGKEPRMLCTSGSGRSSSEISGSVPHVSSCSSSLPSCSSSSSSLFFSRSKSVPVRRVHSKVAGDVRCEAGSGTVSTASTPTEWLQRTVDLPSFKRGCHIITQHIRRAVPEISEYQVGIAHIFVMHTSASLTINENASPDVPLDMEDSLNRIVPEGHHYRHLDEGYDDMPAHVKSSMMGSSLTIPIKSGHLNLGTWQGIWLNEHRNYGGSRSICITIQGQKRGDGRAYR